VNNKNIPYGRQTIDEDDIRAVVEVLRGDYLTTGPYICAFEKKFSSYVGSRYAVAVSSGTAALHLACLAAGIGPGDEVITSPMSFAATANCAVYVGARPVFCDIDSTGNIDPKLVEKKVSPATKAIIPVHYSGLPCRMDIINEIARRHGVVIIEDACHALGAVYKGSKIGSCSHSEMAVFSFHPVKHITTGEGGMITTNSEELYQKLVCLRSHGIVRDPIRFKEDGHGGWYYEMQQLGFNYRMTDIQAALGISQLAKIDRFVKRRRDVAAWYTEAFKDLPLELPKDGNDCRHAYHLYVVKLKPEAKVDRKELYDRLKSMGIICQVHYIPIHTMPYYREKLGYRWGDYPQAEDHYKRVLSLPLYPGLSDEEVNKVIEAVKETLK